MSTLVFVSHDGETEAISIAEDGTIDEVVLCEDEQFAQKPEVSRGSSQVRDIDDISRWRGIDLE